MSTDTPTITVICGSTRFMQEMTDADRELTWAGHIVLKPGCDMKTPDPLWEDEAEAEAGKVRLDELHRAKIRLADEVLVVGDYIGDSTRTEIAYARELGKAVRFTHPEADAPAQPVKCHDCGTERTPKDVDYTPVQAIFGQQLGWYSGDDGEFCGPCITAIMRTANG